MLLVMVILMDCQMPVLDGYSTSQQIRALEATEGYSRSRVTIIALTANAMQEDRDRCLVAGMDDYLSKPVLKESLAAILSKWSQVIYQNICLESVKIPNRNTNGQVLSTSLNLEAIDELEIDWNYLDDMTNHDADFKKQLLETYANSLPEHLLSLQQAIGQSFFNQIEQESHFIKGSSSALGIHGIAKIASILEESSKQKYLPDAAVLLFEKMMYGVQRIANLGNDY